MPRLSRSQREALLRAMAAEQGGVLTRQQLHAAGFSPSSVTRWVRSGRIQAVFPGVYLTDVQALPAAIERAALRFAGPAAILSHTSALNHLGVRERMSSDAIHITLRGMRRSRSPHVVYHRGSGLRKEDVTTHNGLRVTSFRRSLVDVAAMLGPDDLEQIIARAERRGLLQSGELQELASQYAGHRGIRQVRDIAKEFDGPVLFRSEAERICFDLLKEAGLDRPHSNVIVGPYEVDFLWPDLRVILEVDGHQFHKSRLAFERDREKTNWLTARGYTTLRVTWRQLTRSPQATAITIGITLGVARERAAAGRHRDTSDPMDQAI